MDDPDLKLIDERIRALLERAQELYSRKSGEGSNFDSGDHQRVLDDIDNLIAELHSRPDGT